MPFHSNTRLTFSLAVEDGALKAQCSTVTSSEMPHTINLWWWVLQGVREVSLCWRLQMELAGAVQRLQESTPTPQRS